MDNWYGLEADQISPYVSVNTRLMLASVVVDEVTRAKDKLSWGGSQDGRLSVSSAYDMLTNTNLSRQNMRRMFD
ncbi:unnamed protein product [Arabis nemorensis]|uniref:Uncharacterized protein n=1 Tax=Arabis nemorensis TaxID=586526 RepID=A0A565BU29_9BRAS|nr:unnamed protein product [Arabis nemorensis]